MFALDFRSALAASALFACLSTVPSRADEFSWQLAGGAARSESGGSHADTSSLSATYYLHAVDDSGGPLALASFLHPTTRLSAAASDADVGGDPNAYSLGGRYVLPGAQWYAGAEYSWVDLNTPAGAFFEQSDPKGYRLVGGRYFGASTTLELAMGKSKQESRTSGFCLPVPGPCTGTMTFESTTTDWSLDALHVGKLRSLTYSVGGGVRESESDVDVTFSPGTGPTPTFLSPGGGRARTYSLSGELFPSDRLGVKLGYSRPDNSDFDIDSYALSTTWFFTRRVAVQVSFGRASIHDIPSDVRHIDSTGLTFTGRF